MKTIIKLALSNDKKNRTRSILIIASVVLTTMLLTVIGTFVYGSYQSNKVNAKILYGGYHGVFREVDEEAIRQLHLRSEFKTIAKMAVAGSVEAEKNITLYWADDTTYELSNLNKRIMDGSIPIEETDILAEKVFFELLGYPDAQIGDKVMLQVRADLESGYEPKEFVISGFLKDGNSQIERRNYLAYVAEKFYENQTKGKKKDYSVLFLIDDSVKLTTNRAEETIQELGEKCGIAKEKLLINDYYMNWSVNPGLDMIIGGILISGCIILFSIIVIYNIFQVGVVQKIQEYGKIKALGATKRQIRSVVLMEGMLLAVIGSPLGILLGGIIGKILFVQLMSQTNHIRGEIELVKVSIISLPLLGSVFVVSLFSVYLSLRKPMKMVGRLSPVDAIRYQENTLHKNSLRKGKTNLTILTMTLANLSLNRKRTITTVVTMGLSCVLFVILASMIGSIDNEYDARKSIEYGEFQLSIDYSLSDKAYPQNNLDQILKNNPLDQELIQTMKQMDGVTDVKNRDILAMWIWNIEGEETKKLCDVAVLDQEGFSHMANEGGTIGVIDYEMATKENALIYGWSHFLEYNGYSINQPVRAQLETGQSSVSLDSSIQGSFGSSNQDFAITKGTYDRLGLTDRSTGYIWIDCEEKDRERIEEQLVKKVSGLPSSRVIGTGTSLDSARLRMFLADTMGVDPRSVDAICMGEHGDSQMIPWSQVTVGGKNFNDILKDNKARLKEIEIDKVREEISQIAYDIVKEKGATNYGIAAVAAKIIKAVINDENVVMPISAMLHGEYGVRDIYAGVPAVLTGKGVKELVELHLTDEELQQFQISAKVLLEAKKKCDEMILS